ncbi:MAG TPA: aldehyde dehydrogenase family protein [Gemmatimonadales bacterium]|nr:aldehyde dehydrogenase family protein [Gemmatimonadales bacterium]
MESSIATGSSVVFEPPPTTQPQLDQVVGRLKDGARKFVGLSLDQRMQLARAMQQGYLRVGRSSVEAACAAKGIVAGSPLEGEEWTLGPWFVIRHLRLIRESLAALKETGNTRVGKLGRTADQRLTVQVFPAGPIDGLLFQGVRVDVHLQPGVTEEEMENSRARFYKRPDHDGRVVLVLGAGNVNGIPSMDVLTKLFNEGKTCILKMHPVNAYLGPFLEEAFTDAIRQNFLAVVYGGSEEGAYLAQHPDVDEVHLTGSDLTFDTIVWGNPGPEREARKGLNRPVLQKPITAELGNVSPVIVLPGPYSDKQLRYQAEDVAAGLTFNAAFDCNANKVLILPKGWAQRDAFLEGIEHALTRAQPRKAYYPGAHDRWRLYSRDRASILRFGDETAEVLPWTLVRDLDAADASERGFASESFCPIVFETQVGNADPVEFLDQAVTFANNRLWGTLSAGLVVHPKVMKDPVLAGSVERAIATLRYGSVCVNAWSGYLFAFVTPPWGPHPSSTLENIQSGTGWVHNTPMLERVEKAVLRHPITAMPKPTYFPSHRNAHKLMPRMTALEENASWRNVPGVLAAAMRA